MKAPGLAANSVIGGVPPAYRHECVELFSEVAQIFGVARSVGQIYGFLYASHTPVCFSDIVEGLEISKGSASQGLQLMRTLGAVKIATHPARGRNDSADLAGREYFEPELSLRQLVSGVLEERAAPLATSSSDRLSRLRELAAAEDASEFCIDRVRRLETWRKKLKTVLPILTVLLGPKRAAKRAAAFPATSIGRAFGRRSVGSVTPS